MHLPASPSLPVLPARPVGARQTSARPHKLVGQMLIERGALSSEDLLKAIVLQARQEARLGDILLAHGMVGESALYQALAEQYGAELADLRTHPPDIRLIDALGPADCLRDGLLPWRRVGGATVVACCRPEDFALRAPDLTERLGPCRMAVVSETELQRALLIARRGRLIRQAEARVPEGESCRGWRPRPLLAGACMAIAALIALGFAAPGVLFALLCGWATLTLLANALLKLAATIAQTRWIARDRAAPPVLKGPPRRLPMVSILVPLFREREIAAHLIRRLARLSYPKELLDICLVVEEDDTITQAAIAATDLPSWMRQIVVPRGAIKTKPRALNYALDFCKGSIIGVYDAEDAPAPDQIHRVVRRFHDRGPEVACLQGILDFYNTRQNWLSRCFTIEYATWFRLILPGLERLGFVVPLGGTTLFVRREALERLGAWDAHNVTEDADLGLRLARHGYRTELIATVTEEEANCRLWPWVRQRSRWLKGYGMTWAVHMRAPRQLLRALGWRRFLGIQISYLGTLTQFVLAPVIWSFWSLPLGLGHPLLPLLPGGVVPALALLFLLIEALRFSIAALAVSGPEHRGLWRWIPTMHLYFPLATVAAYKGLLETVTRPFYWDKTAHGLPGAAARLSDQRDSDIFA